MQHEEPVHHTPHAALPLVILHNPATLTFSVEDNSLKMAVYSVEYWRMFCASLTCMPLVWVYSNVAAVASVQR